MFSAAFPFKTPSTSFRTKGCSSNKRRPESFFPPPIGLGQSWTLCSTRQNNLAYGLNTLAVFSRPLKLPRGSNFKPNPHLCKRSGSFWRPEAGRCPKVDPMGLGTPLQSPSAIRRVIASSPPSSRSFFLGATPSRSRRGVVARQFDRRLRDRGSILPTPKGICFSRTSASRDQWHWTSATLGAMPSRTITRCGCWRTFIRSRPSRRPTRPSETPGPKPFSLGCENCSPIVWPPPCWIFLKRRAKPPVPS